MNNLEPVDWYSVPDDIPDLPKIQESYVLEHANRIKPLLYRDGKVSYCKSNCNHFNQSFPWDAKVTKPATDLVEVARIWTLHPWSYYGFFKPTVAEVIVQIPPDLLSKVDFFLVRGPEEAIDLAAAKQYVFDKDVHVAQTILYKRSDRPEEVGDYHE